MHDTFHIVFFLSALIVLAISDDNFCMEHLQNMRSTQNKCISDECVFY